MEKLNYLQLEYPNIDFVWAGVRTASPDESVHRLLGFNIGPGAIKLTVDIPDPEKYPAFDFVEWLVNPVGFDKGAIHLEPRGYELHYKDLLRYLIDRKEAVDVIEGLPYKHEYYKQALEYAEEHGVMTYGVLVYAEADDLIEILEDDVIMAIELDQVIASKRYIR